MPDYLKGAAKLGADNVAIEIKFLVELYGLERLAFLTLTYKKPLFDSHLAQSRWHSLVTNHFGEHFERMIAVWERHESDAIHWHALVVCKEDIKTGFDFAQYDGLKAEVKAGRRRHWRGEECGANAALRVEWQWLKDHLRGVWGRFELTPIRSTGDAIARYLAKYVTKQERERCLEDKGCRRVRYVGFSETEVKPDGTKCRRSLRKTSLHRSFIGPGSQLSRAKTEVWAVKRGLTADELFWPRSIMGRGWRYKHKDEIHNTDCRDLLRSRGPHFAKALEMHEKEIADREFKKLYDGLVWKARITVFDTSMHESTPETLGLQYDVNRWAGGVLTPEAAEALGWPLGAWPSAMVNDYLAWCSNPQHVLGSEACAWFEFQENKGDSEDYPDMPWAEETANEFARCSGNRVAMCCPDD